MMGGGLGPPQQKFPDMDVPLEEEPLILNLPEHP